MPYTPPNLQQCVEQSRRDFQAQLPGSNAWLFPNNVAVSAKVFGGLIWGAFRFLSWILKQILVTTCSRDYLYLHGAELGVPPLGAMASTGPVQITGTVGLTIPDNIPINRQDGMVMTTVGDVEIPGGGVVNTTVNTVLTGAMTNTLSGTPLSCAISGVTAVVSLGVLGGTDAESVEAYRQRVLFRKRNPPSVGNPADYARWALDFPGVTRAYVVRAISGPGTVGVYFMMDGTYANGIPTSGDAANLLAYLNQVAPSDAVITAIPPVAQVVNITIANLVPSTPTVKQSITDELTGMFQRRANVAVGSTGLFYYSWIDEAISAAQGEQSHDLTVPAADVTVAIGKIPTLGTITYT